MNMKNVQAMVLASAALLTSGMALATDEKPTNGGMVHCGGTNACKGQSACKSSQNACKGKNSCKGKGFTVMSATDCSAKGGTEVK